MYGEVLMLLILTTECLLRKQHWSNRLPRDCYEECDTFRYQFIGRRNESSNGLNEWRAAA